MKRFLPLVATALFASSAHASSPIDWLQQACAFTNARWICDLGESALLLENLVNGSWERVQNNLENYAKGWLEDAAQTAGQVMCIGTAPNQRCLSDVSGQLKGWLTTQPDKFFDHVFAAGSEFYLSNLYQKFYLPSNAPKDSPTYLADDAIKTQPNVRAKFYMATAKDLQLLEDQKEMGVLMQQSSNILKPGEKPDKYLMHLAELTRPACNPTAPQNCVNPLDMGGGWIAQYKARAKTAVSTREQLQTLVELQAEAAGNDAQNTLELSKRVQQMTQAQIYTNQQLQMLYTALVDEKKQQQLEYQAKLERDLYEALENGRSSASFFSSASQLMFDVANPYTVVDAIGGL
jgi:hypothetical protein